MRDPFGGHGQLGGRERAAECFQTSQFLPPPPVKSLAVRSSIFRTSRPGIRGFPGVFQVVGLRQILLRLPQPLNCPLDPLADCPPVEILLPAEPLEGNALDQVVLEQLLLVGREHLERLHRPVFHPLDVRIQLRLGDLPGR